MNHHRPEITLQDLTFEDSIPPIEIELPKQFYLWADLHLGHKKILESEPSRLYLGETVEQMNNRIIKIWNETVGSDGVILFLGDFSFGNSDATKGFLKRLLGHKILVMGNHDRCRTKKWWNDFFEEVYDCPVKSNEVIYSHEPVSLDYLEKHHCYKNYHGHTHSVILNYPAYKCVSIESQPTPLLHMDKE